MKIYKALAKTYGWGPDYVSRLSHEQQMLYALDTDDGASVKMTWDQFNDSRSRN